MILILIIIVLVSLIIYLCQIESFANNISIVDPYSLYLHKDISEKENWWHYSHEKLPIYI